MNARQLYDESEANPMTNTHLSRLCVYQEKCL